jgi:hypothetical protein
MPEVVSDLLAPPHTSGSRKAPRCGALSLLQKTLHYRGDPAETAAGLNAKLWSSVTAWLRATLFLEQPRPRKFEILQNDLKPKWWFGLLYFAPCRPLRKCAPSPQVCRLTPAPSRAAGGPRRVLCRRRQRYKHVSVVERPPQSYGKGLELVEGVSA